MKIIDILARWFRPSERNDFWKQKDEPEEDKFNRMLVAEASGEIFPFEIRSFNKKGFNIRVEKISGFVSYGHMAWSYPNMEWWHNAAPYLVMHSFLGSVYEAFPQRNFVLVDAVVNRACVPDLKPGSIYKGIILQTSSKGVHVELGLHFGWKCGSVHGFIPAENLKGKATIANMKAGQVRFLAFSEKKQTLEFRETAAEVVPVAVDGIRNTTDSTQYVSPRCFNRRKPREEAEPDLSQEEREQLAALVNTVVDITVIADEYNGKAYLLQDKYRCSLEITESIYGKKIDTVRLYLRKMRPGEHLACEVLAVSAKKSKPSLKLSEEVLSKL